jgi:hypothetical protein
MKKQNDYFGELLLHFLNHFDLDLLFHKQKYSDYKERLAVDLFDRLNDLKTVFDRLQKYPIYFEYFYTSEKDLISDAEAIEYHLHSFIQDIYILQERLIRIIGHLRKDLKTFGLDHDEDLKKILNHLDEQVRLVLGSVTTGSRKRHVHDATVRDSDLSEAKLSDTLKKVDPTLAALVEQKSIELTSKAKNHYIQEAKRNAQHMEHLQDFISPRLGLIIAHFFEQDESKFRSRMSDS